MSVIQETKPAKVAASNTPLAPAARKQLTDAEAALAALEDRRGPLAHKAYGPSSSPEVREQATADLSALLGEIADTGARVTSLKAALAWAIQEDEAKITTARDAIAASQRRAALVHLAGGDKVAEELAAAMASTVSAWQRLIEIRGKAKAACPIGTVWPPDSACTADEIRRLVTAELYRLSNDTTNGAPRAFPGAAFPSLEYQHNPQAIPPLLGRIKAASEHVRKALKGKDAA